MSADWTKRIRQATAIYELRHFERSLPQSLRPLFDAKVELLHLRIAFQKGTLDQIIEKNQHLFRGDQEERISRLLNLHNHLAALKVDHGLWEGRIHALLAPLADHYPSARIGVDHPSVPQRFSPPLFPDALEAAGLKGRRRATKRGRSLSLSSSSSSD